MHIQRYLVRDRVLSLTSILIQTHSGKEKSFLIQIVAIVQLKAESTHAFPLLLNESFVELEDNGHR